MQSNMCNKIPQTLNNSNVLQWEYTLLYSVLVLKYIDYCTKTNSHATTGIPHNVANTYNEGIKFLSTYFVQF